MTATRPATHQHVRPSSGQRVRARRFTDTSAVLFGIQVAAAQCAESFTVDVDQSGRHDSAVQLIVFPAVGRRVFVFRVRAAHAHLDGRLVWTGSVECFLGSV